MAKESEARVRWPEGMWLKTAISNRVRRTFDKLVFIANYADTGNRAN